MQVVIEQKCDELIKEYIKIMASKFIDESLVFFLKEDAKPWLAMTCIVSLLMTLANGKAFNKEQAIVIKKLIVEELDKIIEKKED